MRTTLHLIEDLRCNPCLWDSTSSEYRDRKKKSFVLESLAIKYQTIPSDVEKKIHGLRTQFRREQKKLEGFKKENPSRERKSTWFGFEPMQFIVQKGKDEGKDEVNDEKEETFMVIGEGVSECYTVDMFMLTLIEKFKCV